MLASFYGLKRSATEILLVCSRDILTATLKNLSRFVMRAKVKLSDASGEYSLYGLAGVTLESVFAVTPAPWTKMDRGDASVISLYPVDGVPRALWLAPVTQAAPVGAVMEGSLWAWGEVRSGIAMITTPTVQAFVPQMLNYESVGGVNFKKGCYPGQEVVARSQFRGTLKRRAYAAHADAVMKAGDEVFQEADPEQPCGIVAQAAESPTGGFDAIVSMQVTAAELGGLHLGAAHGPTMSVAPPPYPLLADI
jgi:folate-binding protein YgfZ